MGFIAVVAADERDVSHFGTLLVSLSLASDRWSTLEAAYGSAADIPSLLRRFGEKPDLDAFENLRCRLTGDGDIAAKSAFYAALPHIIEMVGDADRSTRVQVLSHVGWAAAIAASNEPQADLKTDYQCALVAMRDSACVALSSCHDQELRRYLLAAVAAGIGEPEAALALIHLHDAVMCPRCGALASCPSCGLPLEVVAPFRPV